MLFVCELLNPFAISSIFPFSEALVDVILESDSLQLGHLSINYLSRQLSKSFYFGNRFNVKMVQQQSFSPQILEQVVLSENPVVDHEEIEIVRQFFLKNCLGLGSVTVIQIVQVHVAHRLVPHLQILRQVSISSELFPIGQRVVPSDQLVQLGLENALSFFEFVFQIEKVERFQFIVVSSRQFFVSRCSSACR